jgi:hypothetical protein
MKKQSENQMVFDGLKPLKSIEKQTLFLTLGHLKNNEKSMPKWFPKVMNNCPKWSPRNPGSIYS